ncbi:Ankyrin repeat protein 1 [Giardia muris]|uniref:Ankyrin repeat protein 1 n=1 Tax=Giardia muris TaxID=5742 RepID=A0A4Z1TCL5_GIAMU|nr:Ankyrin repeat protein 1 [Giardia muris]|eukprot:TNJ30329.1 Ankyrin repeat protein 1 [Giardia muris]
MPINSPKDWFTAIKAHLYDEVRAGIPRFSRTTDALGQTGLMKAVMAGDVQMVRLLVRYEHSMSTKSGLTALSIAALENSAACCHVLGLYESTISLPNQRTPLMLAADSGCNDALKVLICFYGNERDDFKWSALDYAASKDHTACVETLLRATSWTAQDLSIAFSVAKRAKLTTMTDLLYAFIRQGGASSCSGCKALREALNDARTEVLRLTAELSPTRPQSATTISQSQYNEVLRRCATLEQELDLLKRAQIGQSIKEPSTANQRQLDLSQSANETLRGGLHQATYSLREKDTEIIELYSLVDPTIVITDQTILDDAENIQRVNFPVAHSGTGTAEVEQFQRDEAGNTPLMLAVASHKLNLVKAYMFTQARHQNNVGTTALMMAVSTGFSEAARFLADLEAGIQDGQGQTALMLASANDNVDIVKLLMEEEGKKITASGKTALMIAIEAGSAEAARLLAPLEANIADKSGRKAIHYAAWNDLSEVIRTLLPLEGRSQDSYGYTALMIAALKGHANSARLLKGREAGIQRVDGWTALMAAATLNHFTVASELLDSECRMITNESSCRGAGYTALMAAAEMGAVDTLKLLLPREIDIIQTSGKTALDWALSANPKADRVSKNSCFALLKQYSAQAPGTLTDR